MNNKEIFIIILILIIFVIVFYRYCINIYKKKESLENNENEISTNNDISIKNEELLEFTIKKEPMFSDISVEKNYLINEIIFTFSTHFKDENFSLSTNYNENNRDLIIESKNSKIFKDNSDELTDEVKALIFSVIFPPIFFVRFEKCNVEYRKDNEIWIIKELSQQYNVYNYLNLMFIYDTLLILSNDEKLDFEIKEKIKDEIKRFKIEKQFNENLYSILSDLSNKKEYLHLNMIFNLLMFNFDKYNGNYRVLIDSKFLELIKEIKLNIDENKLIINNANFEIINENNTLIIKDFRKIIVYFIENKYYWLNNIKVNECIENNDSAEDEPVNINNNESNSLNEINDSAEDEPVNNNYDEKYDQINDELYSIRKELDNINDTFKNIKNDYNSQFSTLNLRFDDLELNINKINSLQKKINSLQNKISKINSQEFVPYNDFNKQILRIDSILKKLNKILRKNKK